MKTSAWRWGIGCLLCLGLCLATWPAAAAQEQAKSTVEERKFTFEMRNKPWSAVFEWLADQSQLTFISNSQPTGTFSYVAPNAKQQYTLGEIIDILNEGLAAKKQLLIRRKNSIHLAPADERIDPALVPHLAVNELAGRGRSEVVACLLPLKQLKAQEFAPEIKKLLGPHGEIVVLAQPNKLVVQDTVGNLRRIIDMIQSVEQREAPPAQPKPKAKPEQAPMLRTYNVPGGNATAIVKLLHDAHKDSTKFRITALGPNSIMVYASPDDQMEIARHLEVGARVSTELIPLTVLDPSRVAETLRQMFGEPRMGGPYVEAETDRNALIVRGTASQMMDIKEVLTALGEGGPPKGGVRTLNLQQGSAATLAEALQRLLGEMRPNLPVRVTVPGVATTGARTKTDGEKSGTKGAKGESSLTITAMGNRLIVASDNAEALALAVELFRLMTQTRLDADFEVIRLKNGDARNVARVIEEAFNGPMGGGMAMPRNERVRVVADQGSNSLLLKASPIDTLTIRRLLETALDADGAGDAPQQKRGPGKKGAN